MARHDTKREVAAPELCVLGVDIGTGGCKVAVVSATGRLLATVGASYPTHSPRPGWAEQDPQDWLTAVASATREAVTKAGVIPASVAALGLSSAAHVGVLLDAQNQPVRRAILWSDQRADAAVRDLEARCGPEILRRTYQKVSTTWTLPHLLWVRTNEPDAWRRMRRVLLSKDYVLEWLTGRALTDPATALSAMLFEPREGRWSPWLCGLAGLPPNALPEIASATAVAGGLLPAAAEALGLCAGTPVVTGTLDSAAETLGAGVTEPGGCVLRLATAGGIHLVLPAPRPHPQLITYPHPVELLWFCQAGTSSCASAVQWAMQAFAGEDGPVSYDEWDALAATVEVGAEGLLFHPYLRGERCPYWNPALRGSLFGLSPRHGRAHVARAVYEGVAFSIRDAMRVLAEVGAVEGPLVVVGGGATSRVWVNIMSAVLGRAVSVARHADSSYGAALLALVGSGLSESLRAAARSAGDRGGVVEASADARGQYDRLFAVYRSIQAHLAPLWDAWPDGCCREEQ